MACVRLLSAGATCSIATAATLTWTGAGLDSNISNSANWSPSQVPALGDTLIFSGSTRVTPQLAASLTVASLSFGSTAQVFTLGGAGVYTVNAGGITNSSTATETINNGIVLGASQTWNAASGNLAFGGAVNLQTFTLTTSGTQGTTITGVISGTGGLTKSGTGTLTLAGTNTYSGLTTITAGTLKLGASGALPSAGNVTLLGGTLDINGQSPVVGTLTIGNGSVTTATSVTDSAAVKGTITLNGDIAYNGTAAFSFPPGLISAKIQLAAGMHSLSNPNGNYSSAANYDVVLSGIISGTGGLSKDGTNANFWAALNAANTYFGPTAVTGGNLYLGVTNTLPSLSAVSVSSGATLILNPTGTENGVVAGNYSQNVGSLAGAGSVTLGTATLTTGNDGTSTSFTGVISGTGGFAKVGAGVQTLGGTNTYTGTTSISGGKVIVTGALGATAVTVAGGGALGGAGIIGVATSATGGTVTVAGGATAATRGVIDLTDGAIGTLTITGNSTGAGTVTLTIGGTAGNSSALTFDIGSNTTDKLAVLQKAQLNAGGATITLTQLPGTALAAGTYSLITFASQTLTGGYSLATTAGNGNTYSLSATGTAENLIVTALPTPAIAYWKGDQGAQWNSFAAGANTANWYTTAAAAANTSQVPGATTDVFLTVTSGATNLVNTLGANFSVKSLNFTASSGSGTIGGANTLTIGTGGISSVAGAGAQSINTNIVLGASQTWTNNGSALTVGGTTITGTGLNLTTAGAGNISISAAMQTGTGTFTQNGSGTVQFAGTAANTYTGLTTVNAGELDLNKSAGVVAIGGNLTIGDGAGGANSDIVKLLASGQLASTSAVLINGTSGKLDLNGFTQTIGSLANTGTVTAGGSTLNLGAGTLTVGNTTSTTFSGAITGTGGSLVKQGTGILQLAGTTANTYSGLTTVNAGELDLNKSAGVLAIGGDLTIGDGAGGANSDLVKLLANGQIAPTATVLINASSGRLDMNGFTQTIGALSDTGIVTLGGSSLNLGANTLTLGSSGNATFSGAISGTGSLVKQGTGTFALAGTNTYTGMTTVNAGELDVNALAGNVTIGDGVGGANSDILKLLPGGTLPTTAVILINGSSGKLDLNGNSRTVASIADAGTVTAGGSSLNLGAGTLTVNTTTSGTFSGAITGTGGITKQGTGTLVLAGTSTYSGTTTLSAGTLSIGSNTALGTGTLVLNANGVSLAAAGGPWTIGNAVTVSRNFSFNSTDSLTLSGPVTLTGNRQVTIGSSGVLTISGVISNSGNRSLTKLGTGTLALNGANTFSNGLILSAGTVIVGNNAAAGTGTLSLGTGTIQAGVAGITLPNAVTLSGNTTFSGTQNLNFSGAANLSGSRILTVLNPSTTFSGVISGGGNLITKAGAGTLTLSGTNTFGGGLTITNGTVVLDSNAAAGTGTITVGDVLTTSTSPASLFLSATAGRTVTNPISVPVGSTGLRTIGGLNTTGVNTFSGTVSLGTNLTLTEPAGGTLSFTGVVSGAGGLTKTGAGIVSLGNANTFTGATLVSAGTLAYVASNAIGTGSVTVNGGSLDMGANRADSVGAVTLQNGSILGTGTSTLTSTSGFAVQSGTVSAILAGAVNLTKDTSGTVTLSAANTYSGTTTVNAGTLAYGVSNALGVGVLTVNGGTLDMGTGRTDSVGAVTLTSGSILGGAGSVLTSTFGFTLQSGTVTAGLAGTVGVTKNTAGTVLIFGANAYTLATTISAGTLRLGATETLPNASAVTIAAGATLDMNAFSDTVGSLAGAGNLLLTTGVLTAGGDNTSTSFTGTAGGSGGITKMGTGTLTLGGVDSYIGATNVNAGTLTLGNAGAGPSASRVTVAAGATFNDAGFAASIGSLAGAGSVTLGAGTLTAGGDGTFSTFSGIVSGTGGFTKAGTGTLTMTGANTFSGAINVNAGNLVLSGAIGTAASATSVSIRTGASLVLDNSVTENANRIGDATAINIQGGSLQLISDANGTTESVGQLNFLLGPASISVAHNGTAAQSSALTFSSIGSTITGATLNFGGTGLGAALGTSATGPHIYITGQPNGLIGGWARVGSDFADYQVNGVVAFSNYYTGPLGVNVNDPSTIVKLTSTSPLGAYTLTNAGTTNDGGLLVADLPLVDLGTSATRTLNLVTGGLIKTSAPDTVISGAGRLTAGGTAAGALQIAVASGSTLNITSSIINNAGTDGIYGNAGDGVVGLVKSDFGTLVLSGNNSFSGDVYLNEGALAVGADAAFGALTNDVFLSGGVLMITAGFTANTGRRFVVTAGLTSTLDVATGQTFLLSGASDLLATGSTASTFVKTGAGDFVLASSNPNFTGTVVVSSGALELRTASSLGTGSIALNGGTLRLRADTSTTFTNPFSLLADSTIAASTITSGTPVLSPGVVTIGAQTLSLSSTGGATLNIAGANLTGNATFNTTAGTTTMGAINGAYGFTKTGAGTLQLTAAGTYTGVTDVQGGTLRLANVSAIPLASNVNVGAAGTVDLNSLGVNLGSISGSGSITLGSGTLTVGGNGLASNFGGSISGTGGLVKTAGETLTLSGANTYSGPTAINAGVIVLGANNALPTGTALSISAAAGLDLGGFGQQVASITGSGALAIGTGALTVGDSTNATFAGTITGTGLLTKVGSGMWSLSGNSPYTGLVTVAGGTIEVLANSAIGDPVVMAGGQIFLAGGVTVSTEPLILAGTGSSGGGALQVQSGAATWAGPILLSANASTGAAAGSSLTLGDTVNLSGFTLTVSSAGTTLSTGVITGAGTLQKTDAGALTLSGANDFTGRTVVVGGTLNVASNGALGATGLGNETEVRSGASISFGEPAGINIGLESLLLVGNGTTGTGAIQNNAGDNNAAGPITLTANASVNIALNTSLSLDGGIGESALGTNFTKNGPGMLILGGTTTFTGTLAVTDGTLQIAANNTINGNPGVSLSATATLDMNDFSDTLGSLSGAGTVILGTVGNGGSLSVGANNASTTFTGTITGTGDFEKIGTGVLTLTTANTYAGTTTITAGTLVAGNDLAFGTAAQAVVLNGGGLASNSDTRTLAYPITVNPVAGNKITGSNSTTLTGTVTSGGAGSTLDVNFTDPGKTLTVNPGTAGAFAPGAISLTSGTLLLGGANKIAASTDVIMNGGTLNTGGFSNTLGALTVAANSVLDFGTTNNVNLQFSSSAWTGGTLRIDNWTGSPLIDTNQDRLLVVALPDASLLGNISFTGFTPGATAISFGGLYEIVPVPEPATIFGGIALVGLVCFRERRRLLRLIPGTRRMDS